MQLSMPSPETSTTMRIAFAGIAGITSSAIFSNIGRKQVKSPPCCGSVRMRAAMASASAREPMRCQSTTRCGLSAQAIIANRMPPCGPPWIAPSTDGSSSALAMPCICS